MIFTLTGCVKFNAEMDIKWNKAMDFSIIYAIDKTVMGDDTLFKAEDISKMEEKGLVVKDYEEGNMKGISVLKHVKNIDEVSSSDAAEYNLSSLVDDSATDVYLFKVKKGFLKNTYTAKLDLNTSGTDFETDTNEDFSDSSNIDSSSFGDGDFDFSQMASQMDLSFKVKLPYAVKSSNATSKENHDKDLKWDITLNSTEPIEFEFDMYNIPFLCLIGAGLILIILIIVVVIISVGKKKNKKTDIKESNNEIQEVSLSSTDERKEAESEVLKEENEKTDIEVFDPFNSKPNLENNVSELPVNESVEEENKLNQNINENANINQQFSLNNEENIIPKKPVPPIISENMLNQPTEPTIVSENAVNQPTESTIESENIVSQPTEPTIVSENIASQPTELTIISENVVSQPTESTIVSENIVSQPTEPIIVSENIASQPIESTIVSENVVSQPIESTIVSENIVSQPTESTIVNETITNQDDVNLQLKSENNEIK